MPSAEETPATPSESSAQIQPEKEEVKEDSLPVAAETTTTSSAGKSDHTSTYFLYVLLAVSYLGYYFYQQSKEEKHHKVYLDSQKELYSFGKSQPREENLFQSWQKEKNIANRQRTQSLLNIDDEEINV